MLYVIFLDFVYPHPICYGKSSKNISFINWKCISSNQAMQNCKTFCKWFLNCWARKFKARFEDDFDDGKIDRKKVKLKKIDGFRHKKSWKEKFSGAPNALLKATLTNIEKWFHWVKNVIVSTPNICKKAYLATHFRLATSNFNFQTLLERS